MANTSTYIEDRHPLLVAYRPVGEPHSRESLSAFVGSIIETVYEQPISNPAIIHGVKQLSAFTTKLNAESVSDNVVSYIEECVDFQLKNNLVKALEKKEQ